MKHLLVSLVLTGLPAGCATAPRISEVAPITPNSIMADASIPDLYMANFVDRRAKGANFVGSIPGTLASDRQRVETERPVGVVVARCLCAA